MEIKPSWLLEGEPICLSQVFHSDIPPQVAPHFFKPADLEQLAVGDKKMPKTVGSSTTAS